ncbi:MAG: hypothetical protein E5X74_00595 [Mesorhizobium sp.]|uniref:hypothetical protein n=1 Tax=Mesorhizobium sp. TaxID=1871066 RepID=UPI00122B4297|nr:hypothetical protein [Mesorhizobium sp.]TIO78795.1 MAG: hypothetical protein E5X75_06645 [Mesorhizobium sp.]TIO87551.1 MAG: hypothetical protein E5X74_00595 [Mesorhizobium sp.]
MSKFKDALERGKEARRRQEKHDSNVEAERDALTADFGEQAKVWLNDVAVASLEAAKAEVASEVIVDIDTSPRREMKASTPSICFQIYSRRESEKAARRTFTVKVEVSGAVSVSSPGTVAKDVGNIGDRSDLRFRSLIAELIEEAAKDT